MSSTVNNGRQFFRPKMPECAVQCPSCPFRISNHEEFGAIVQKLRDKEGLNGKTTKSIVGFARMSLFEEAKNRGDFMCHTSVYDSNMDQRPQKEWRQCPGATKIYKSGAL